MSLDDYSGLFTATKQWVESKRKEVAKRNFPNSVAEMKVRVQHRLRMLCTFHIVLCVYVYMCVHV